jgi:hypothetical protein
MTWLVSLKMNQMDFSHLIHSTLYMSVNDTLRNLAPDWLRPIIGIFIGSIAIWLTANIRALCKSLKNFIARVSAFYKPQPNQIHLSIQHKSSSDPYIRATLYAHDLVEWITRNYADCITEFITTSNAVTPVNLSNFVIDPEMDIRVDVHHNQIEREDDHERVIYTSIDIRLFSWRVSSREIQSFLEKCKLEMQILSNLDPNKCTFMRMDDYGTHSSSNQLYSANFDNLAIRRDDKARLMTYLDRFADKDRLRHLSLPDRAFIMLYGPPGTGKTSLIKAMAQHTGRILVRLSIGPNTSSHGFRTMFFSTFSEYGFDKAIYVLEEIDTIHTAFLKRTEKSERYQDQMSAIMQEIKSIKNDEDNPSSKSNTMTICDILEAFDGLCETPGLMMIATTNHLEALDPAIVRRFGLRLKMGLLCRETFSAIVSRHYETTVSDADWDAMSVNAERMSPNNLIDLCVQIDEYKELVSHVSGLELGDSRTLVESEQSAK